MGLEALAEWDFHFNWLMKVCLVIACVLGLTYLWGFQNYRVHAQDFYNKHAPYTGGLDTYESISDYVTFNAPELVVERDNLAGLFWVYTAFLAVGVPKPTKATLNKAYIAVKGKLSRGEKNGCSYRT